MDQTQITELKSFFKGKKVLITGITGFKGGWLSQILLNFGAIVSGIGLDPLQKNNLFSSLKLSEKTKTYIQDIRDFEKIKKIIEIENPEIVFHLAAQPLVRESYDNPRYTLETNILGTTNLLHSIKEVGTTKSLVVITTDKVYKDQEWDWPYRENDELGGYDPYSASKACMELITNSYLQSFFNIKDYGKTHTTLVATARAGNVIGGGDWSEDRLIPDIIKAVYEKNEKVLLRNPHAIRPWQHVLEPLTGYMLLAKKLYQKNKEFSNKWNFGPGENNFITVEEMVKKGIDALKKGDYFSKENLEKHETKILKLDSSKAKSGLNWKPSLNISQTINWTFEWYKRYYNKENIIDFTNSQINDFFGKTKDKEEIKKKINELIKEYYLATKKVIPLNKVPVSGKIYDEKELINGVDSILEGWWTEGYWNNLFEEKIKSFLGVNHCLTTNSGSSANLLALNALASTKLGDKRIKKGDNVITIAAGFPTTINPIIQIGAIPIFVDVDLETYNAKIEDIKKAINPKTKAIILPHTLGNPFNINQIKEICEKNNLWLIEDNCDAFGSRYDGKYTGTFGDLATLSFYPAHHITTAEGGAILTNNPLLYKIVRSIRDWGRDCWCPTGKDNTCKMRFSWQFGNLPEGYDHKYIYSEIGYNLKMTEFQAAIGVAQIDKLKKFQKIRQENFLYLESKLKSLEEYFIFPKHLENSEPSWFGFLLTIKNKKINREDLMRYLNGQGIATRLLFGGNMTKQPSFVNNNIDYQIIGNLENTDIIMNKTFWLGIYQGLRKEHLDYAVQKIKEYINKTI
jgi:CDP-4-dehydro-6-deoxyglucose reductase, E1